MAVRDTRALEANLSPERQARIAERVREAEFEMLLQELQHQAAIAGADVAGASEAQGDMSLTALGQIVRSLGGTLTIRVAVPGKGELTLNGVDLKRSA